ncbi:MAG: sel1 repeat family protein [Hyphomicrobiales bacterium]|nr:sel1 repeat family protein [Hyphomicrobiales bacterium]MCP5002119.1 sel1 repeat family protein [Hyphomicrobiales bacterium]
MQISSLMLGRVIACMLAMTIGSAGSAVAFDPDAGVSEKSGPLVLFKFGFSAYKKGKKDDAVEAYRHAAEQGHPGARWALANMYAAGDGVIEDDYAAFKIYDRIAREGIEPGSSETGYFVNALVSLASYYRRGIPDSPVNADPIQARQLYFQAASAFGMPEAQFQLGRMMLAGEGGRTDLRQAKKWLNRARNSGHPGAAALFGDTIFQEGHTVRGLAYMTVALERANISDRMWIRTIQEQAFSIADEADRRTAISLAQDMLTKGKN